VHRPVSLGTLFAAVPLRLAAPAVPKLASGDGVAATFGAYHITRNGLIGGVSDPVITRSRISFGECVADVLPLIVRSHPSWIR